MHKNYNVFVFILKIFLLNFLIITKKVYKGKNTNTKKKTLQHKPVIM